MVELDGLPTPRVDWSSTDAPQALKKFKNLGQKRGRASELPSDMVR